jgi:hypothetical protein
MWVLSTYPGCHTLNIFDLIVEQLHKDGDDGQSPDDRSEKEFFVRILFKKYWITHCFIKLKEGGNLKLCISNNNDRTKNLAKAKHSAPTVTRTISPTVPVLTLPSQDMQCPDFSLYNLSSWTCSDPP